MAQRASDTGGGSAPSPLSPGVRGAVLRGSRPLSMHAGIHDRPSRRTSAVTVAVLVAACVVAFSPGGADAVAAGAVGAPIAWGACDPPGTDLQCARISVPLDWDDPGGRTISLAVI